MVDANGKICTEHHCGEGSMEESHRQQTHESPGLACASNGEDPANGAATWTCVDMV